MARMYVLMLSVTLTVWAEAKYVYPGYNIPNNYHYMKQHNYPEPGPDLTKKYCEIRQPEQCCPGRDDDCTVRILDRVCYCDIFCNRTQADCCPDFFETCIWPLQLQDEGANNCRHNGRLYKPGDQVGVNCNNCTCIGGTEYTWRCTREACLIRDDVINHVASEDFGWEAVNYTFLWGLTLAQGIRYRLGTYRPQTSVLQMTSITVHPDEYMPEEFNSLEEWPDKVHPVFDQGNCASSWAVSTASVAADRLSIHSNGILKDMLSPQRLISCNADQDQQGCRGGHLDRAWWYLRLYGTVSEECYPYRSGATDKAGPCRVSPFYLPEVGLRCPAGRGITSRVYKATPPYRIAPNEREIMKEIKTNGPVQATMEVKEDFYMYQRGVYKYTMPPQQEDKTTTLKSGYHSVRILGWGVDKSGPEPIKYWLCANSWGTGWGENGLFRIIRGVDECEIESFVIGVWGKVDGRQIVKRQRGQRRRPRIRGRHRGHRRNRPAFAALLG